MARKPSRLRKLLKEQARLFEKVYQAAQSEADSKRPVDLWETSKGNYRQVHLTINENIGYQNAPSQVSRTVEPTTVTIRRYSKEAGKMVTVDTGRAIQLGTKRHLAGKSAPQLQRFSEPVPEPNTDCMIRVGTTPARKVKFRDPLTGEDKFGRILAKPKYAPVGTPGIKPKDGGKDW